MSLYSDLPITKKEQDAFGRTKFIDDLTSFIEKQGVEPDERKQEHRSISDNLVIGIYGPWGSGKTSVVNCVQDELINKGFDTIYFNPWRYKDEDFLLLDLFKLIASKVNKHLDGSMKAEFSKFLLKYSKYLVLPKISFGGVEVDTKDTARAALEGLGDFLKEENTLDDYKNKINGILRELKKPIVIFVDDIDRLDKHEIQLVFKTIKLTAAFSNIIYVLSFDDEMVAKSIGENYSEGREKDGKEFLEKIVQVPLRLPEHSVHILYKNLIESINIDFTAAVPRYNVVHSNPNLPFVFTDVYFRLVTSYMKTPREIKRYKNALSFAIDSLPLIDVNDIMILEIIRIKLPGTFKELVKLNNALNLSSRDIYFNTNYFKETLTFESSLFGIGKTDDMRAVQDCLTFLFGMDFIGSINTTKLDLTHHPGNTEKSHGKRIVNRTMFNEYIQFTKISI